MRRLLRAALAIVAMASCAKESATIDPTIDQVAATFTAASITRVANNTWETGNQIGISMVENGTLDLTSGGYENVSYTVSETTSGTFSADDDVIYFPVDDSSSVDFYAYYPQSSVDADKSIDVSVADQSYAHIDVVAAKAVDKTKASPSVTFSDTEAFEHQLSKISITLIAGDGIDDLDGLKTTIKGQYTTAKFNIYTFDISGEGDIADITAITETDGTAVEAILIPTTGTATSTIVFTLDGDDYVWDTSTVAFEQGKEHSYEATLSKTGLDLSGADIKIWELNSGGDITTNIYVAPPIDIELLNGVYQINTAKGLRAFADLVNGTTNSSDAVTSGTGFAEFGRNNLDIDGALTSNIDLSTICYHEETTGNDVNWTPIGTSEYKYEGTFDGGCYEVQNLYINTASSYQGLFGYTGNGVYIKNLGVTGSISAASSVGGLVGCSYDYSDIINCYNKCNISATGYRVGGIIGFCNELAYVVNCYNTGNISSSYTGAEKSNVGGIAGDNACKLINCYSAGGVSSSKSNIAYLGGVVGYNNEQYVLHCYYDTTVITSDYDGKLDYTPTQAVGTNDPGTITGTTGMTTDAMKHSDFVTTLNNNVTADKVTYGCTDMCEWKQETVDASYPIFSWQ